MKQLIVAEVKPLIARRYGSITSWSDYGDPSLMHREQSDSDRTASEVIEEELKTTFLGGEMDWQTRREAWKDLLNRNVDGLPMFQISKHEMILHRALNGGWHYYRDASGKVLNDKPVKDIHSHPADAVSHGIAMIFSKTLPQEPRQAHALSDFDPYHPEVGMFDPRLIEVPYHEVVFE
jgi:hypothetical protein